MKLHNPENDEVVRQESVEIATDEKRARILQSKLVKSGAISLEVEADDDGGDPYNNTGRHIVLPEWDD